LGGLEILGLVGRTWAVLLLLLDEARRSVVQRLVRWRETLLLAGICLSLHRYIVSTSRTGSATATIADGVDVLLFQGLRVMLDRGGG
jgi:hypothetical protein